MRDLRLASLSAVFAFALSGVPAQAETVNCTNIVSVPMTITAPGVYCLKQAIATNLATGAAIEVQASNVVIDMNGFRLGNGAAGLGTEALGIHALNRVNITVRNGTIRGFMGAVVLEGDAAQGHLVEDIRADGNTACGICVAGLRTIVRNNQVVATGGSTVEVGPGHFITAILFEGSGHRAINNDIASVTQGGAEAAAAIVFANGGANNFAVDNRITESPSGIFFEGGSGKYRDNLTSGVTAPYTGGTDAGGNN